MQEQKQNSLLPYYVAICAMDPNRVIGRDGKLPWRIKEEMQFFKDATMGFPVLMGRKTWESLRGKPLPRRKNIVLSSSLSYSEKYTVIRDLDELELVAATSVFVIGGAQLYKEMMPRCKKVIVSRILKEYEGDTHMPEFEQDFKLTKILKQHPEFVAEEYRRANK